MASDLQVQVPSALGEPQRHASRKGSLSLRPSHLSSSNIEMSGEEEHSLCHHDHEHEGLRARHEHGTTGGGEEVGEHNISLPTATKHAELAVAPFLAKHIPTQYNPVGHMRHSQNPQSEDLASSSTRFCYRHRPDLKCRRQANEPSMEQLQHVSQHVRL